jgi:hypothetical protein
MSLVWVLFGSECDYYKGLCNVYATLELKEVMTQKSSFTAEHCHRITWAILDDGRVHFDDVKTTLDFRGPEGPVFLQSYLINILNNIRYAIPVECTNFPDKWKRKDKTTMDKQRGRNTGGGSGQQRGGDRPSPGTSQLITTPRWDFGAAQGYGGMGGQGQFTLGTQGSWWPFQGGAYPGGQYQGGPSPPGGQLPTH